MKIDFEQLRELLSIVSQTDICELSVESGEERITVKKTESRSISGTLPQASAITGFDMNDLQLQANSSDSSHESKTSTSPSSSPTAADRSNLLKITSPMVGTFYRSPAPNKPPFVEAGDIISVGQTVCIIEAMKLMNDLPSEVSGKIIDVLAETGATVEYGQTLFLVDPAI